MKKLNNILMILILGLALALRLSGITHGLPIIYHPDEPTIINSALALRFDMNPKHFDWPHLYIYVNYFTYMIFAKVRDLSLTLGYKEFFDSTSPFVWDDQVIFYLITRILTAILGAFTVIPIYLSVKNVFNQKMGLLAALLFAIIPFHVRHSHYSLADAPMVFLSAMGMFFASKLIKDKDPLDYAGSGFYVGLAASTKYNGGLTSIVVPFAHFIRIFTKKDEKPISFLGILNLCVAGLMAVVGFVLGTPFAVLDFDTFVRTDGPKGALWQFTNVGSVALSERLPKFFEEMMFRVSDDLGYSLIILFFVTGALVLIRLLSKLSTIYDSYLLAFLLPALILLFYISGFERSRSHYFMMAYPYISVVAAYGAYLFYQWLPKAYKAGIIPILCVLIWSMFYLSVDQAISFSNGDTRTELYTWLHAQAVPPVLVVVNSTELQSAVKYAQVNTSKGSPVKSGSQPELIVIEYDSEDDFLNTTSEYILPGYKRVYQINNQQKLGPNIAVFKK